MALQGTLETFSVPEVLRLLSSTRKTGLLALEGDRGRGRVWLGEGSIISARSDHEGAGDVDATLFDLLRFSTGEFVFEPDATPDHPVSDEVDVDEALGRAEELLAEWREIESVVPSLLVGVRLARELNEDSVTVTAQQWRSLAAIGGGTSAASLGQRLELGELDTCRRLRDLVEADLVELTDDVVVDEPVDEPVVASVDFEPEPAEVDRSDVDDLADAYDDPKLVDHDLSQDEVASLSTNLAGFVARAVEADEPADATDDFTVDVTADAEDHAEDHAEAMNGFDTPRNGHAPIDPESQFDDPEPTSSVETADDFLSQLTNLSPKAAAAIEATAEEAAARGEAEPADERADDQAPEGDEEINRNLLLKFLSSTKN